MTEREPTRAPDDPPEFPAGDGRHGDEDLERDVDEADA